MPDLGNYIKSYGNKEKKRKDLNVEKYVGKVKEKTKRKGTTILRCDDAVWRHQTKG